MNRSIRIAPDARFSARYSVERLRAIVEPFIEEVARDAVTSAELEDVVWRAAARYPEAAAYFNIEPGQVDATFGLLEQHLFAEREVSALSVDVGGVAGGIEVAEPETVCVLQEVLEVCSSGRHSLASATRAVSDAGRSYLRQLWDMGVLTERAREFESLPWSAVPGVHRLQHASLLYRSANSGVLVDPHLHSRYRPDAIASDIYKDQLEGSVDAILISHFHEDHFYLASLLMFPLDTPIVVPKVPRSSIICADMQALLRQCGFRNVIAVDWYSAPLQFGDARVHVLPFFGEQPLRFESMKHSDLRNWGNTYVVETDDYTSWFLIDSGADARGSMQEVAHHVRGQFGTIDIILSNLRRFHASSPFYINGGFNWLTLSPSQIRDFSAMRTHCITLGPRGVADICRTVNARYYLPYAHWWGDVGSIADSGVDTPGQEERALVTELQECLHAAAAATRIVPWRIGDAFVSQPSRGLVHRPIR